MSGFTVLKDGVNNGLEIIRHDESGFFNITKMAILVNEINERKIQPAGIPAGPSKPARNWFSNKVTKSCCDNYDRTNRTCSRKFLNVAFRRDEERFTELFGN